MTIDENQTVEEKNGVFFEINEENDSQVNFKTNGNECGFSKEPIFQYGPFVLTSKEELAKAFEDYQGAKNGFEGAREWSSKIKDLKYAKPPKN